VVFLAKSRCPRKKGGTSFLQRAPRVLGGNKGLNILDVIIIIVNVPHYCVMYLFVFLNASRMQSYI
jgi:hypothetical protein